MLRNADDDEFKNEFVVVAVVDPRYIPCARHIHTHTRTSHHIPRAVSVKNPDRGREREKEREVTFPPLSTIAASAERPAGLRFEVKKAAAAEEEVGVSLSAAMVTVTCSAEKEIATDNFVANP